MARRSQPERRNKAEQRQARESHIDKREKHVMGDDEACLYVNISYDVEFGLLCMLPAA